MLFRKLILSRRKQAKAARAAVRQFEELWRDVISPNEIRRQWLMAALVTIILTAIFFFGLVIGATQGEVFLEWLRKY